MVDLHLHSNCSDGTYDPGRIPALAHAHGLAGIALTDHDTISGNDEFLVAARALGVPAVAGVEISAEYVNPESQRAEDGEMHILGYFPRWDAAAEEVLTPLAVIRDNRHERNPLIIDRLRAMGLDISYEEVCRHAACDVVGRPHIAAILLHKGYVKSAQEAFDRYIGDHAPAYVAKRIMAQETAIAMIVRAGGVAVLAHPRTLRIKQARTLIALLEQLRGYGLAGIEAYYAAHTVAETEQYGALAARLDLLVTGGSDFHGAHKPELKLGSGFGNLCVPDACFSAIMQYAPIAERIEH
jgi:predicted metal-dependent phosphoesterase TrpH